MDAFRFSLTHKPIDLGVDKMVSINWSAMNTTFMAGGVNPILAKQYVTIDSCRTYIQQTEYWMYFYGTMFVVMTIVTAILIYKLKKKV